MENTYTLIIHGWSDCSASFVEMKKRFEERGIGNVESILYADYQSREDNITFNDVVDGLRGWVNKPGTDGTVVIAGSSVDSVKLNLDFSDSDAPYRWQKTKTANDYAFGVLEGLDHGTITSEFEKSEREIVDLTIEALSITSEEQFSDFRSKIKKITDATYSKNAGRGHNNNSRYQQFIIRAVDDHDIGIRDYTIEFYVYKSAKEEERLIGKERYFNQIEQMLSEEFHRVFTREFHTHSKDSSYRRLLVNMADMNELIEKAKMQLGPFVLSMKIFVPAIDRGIYYDLDSLQNVVIYHSENKDLGTPMLFYGNTTTLVELKVKRQTSYVKISKEGKG